MLNNAVPTGSLPPVFLCNVVLPNHSCTTSVCPLCNEISLACLLLIHFLPTSGFSIPHLSLSPFFLSLSLQPCPSLPCLLFSYPSNPFPLSFTPSQTTNIRTYIHADPILPLSLVTAHVSPSSQTALHQIHTPKLNICKKSRSTIPVIQTTHSTHTHTHTFFCTHTTHRYELFS